MLHWLAQQALGHIGAYIGFALIFIISLWQLIAAISKQNARAISENTTLLLFSICTIVSIFLEGFKPLKLLSEVLAFIGMCLAGSLFYWGIFAKKKDTAGKTSATTVVTPSDKIWPPSPTSHP